MNLIEIGEFARELRLNKVAQDKNYTARYLAEKAGVDRSWLSKLENGQLKEAGFGKVNKVLVALGYELDAKPRRSLPTLGEMLKENAFDKN